ncbi:MAG: YhbY family RNA-binding protein [Acidobacteriota bacterium]
MRTLTPAARRALRAKAHHLEPVVSIGQQGLTPGVLHEIDVSLAAHELIKIRVFGDSRTEREALLARICAELGAAAVQHLGKLLIVWRPAPEEPAPAPRSGARKGKSAARKAPQARRPRSPLPRAPARPPRGKGPFEAPAGSRRRHRDTASAGKPAAAGRGTPHGKSASSSRGAAGARRRRKAISDRRA